MVLRSQSRKRGGLRRRAAIYIRVSSDRQAAHEISLLSQESLLRKGCADRDFDVAQVFCDQESAYNGKRRPAFEEFYELATSADRPFDVLFVHSLSRFTRDTLFSEQVYRELERCGVELISLTEHIEGESGWMMRQMIAMFNEQSSRETSKHVKRSRIENANQGFWNGGRPPIGYMAVDAGLFGDKMKRRLDKDPEWEPIVKKFFAFIAMATARATPLVRPALPSI